MTMPDLPQGPYGPPPEQPQPRKRHRVRNTILAVSGGLVVIVVLAATLGGSKTPATPAAVNTPSAHAAVTTAPSTPPALSAGDQEFVSDMRSQYGFNGTTDSAVLSIGTTICTQRSTGLGQHRTDALVGTMVSGSSTNDDAITRLAEKDLCPAYLPPQTVTYIVTGTPALRSPTAPQARTTTARCR